MKDSVQTTRTIIIAVLLLILGGLIGYRTGQQHPAGKPFNPTDLTKLVQAQPSAKKNIDFDAFWEAWQLLEKDYIETEKLDSTKMVDGAIAGMTASLGDPYTMYLPPVDNKRSGEDLAGAFFGVGIELGYVDNVLAVVAPVKGTPAERAGLQPGDLILKVKDPAKNLDAETTGWSLIEAVDKIRGPKDSPVILTILRRKDKNDTEAKPFEVTLKREEIVVKSVELAFVEHAGKRVAHLKVIRFGERTNDEWDEAVNQILAEKNNVKGVVLDMRNNPGGYFDGAIYIASDFIKNGTVVAQKDRNNSREFTAKGKARLVDLPVEVLVNKGSASASEIVAGALRDRREAKLIGEKTFGKGTVQDRRELSNGGGIHITVAQWLLPKGEWIHHEGIPVNIEAKDDPETKEVDEALNRAIEEI